MRNQPRSIVVTVGLGLLAIALTAAGAAGAGQPEKAAMKPPRLLAVVPRPVGDSTRQLALWEVDVLQEPDPHGDWMPDPQDPYDPIYRMLVLVDSPLEKPAAGDVLWVDYFSLHDIRESALTAGFAWDDSAQKAYPVVAHSVNSDVTLEVFEAKPGHPLASFPFRLAKDRNLWPKWVAPISRLQTTLDLELEMGDVTVIADGRFGLLIHGARPNIKDLSTPAYFRFRVPTREWFKVKLMENRIETEKPDGKHR